jgi:hypothetical protein
VNGNPLPWFQASLLNQGSVGCDESAAEACGVDKSDRVWQSNEVDIGLPYDDLVGKAAPVGESGLRLSIANVCVAQRALVAIPTSATERNRNSLTDTKPFDT